MAPNNMYIGQICLRGEVLLAAFVVLHFISTRFFKCNHVLLWSLPTQVSDDLYIKLKISALTVKCKS